MLRTPPPGREVDVRSETSGGQSPPHPGLLPQLRLQRPAAYNGLGTSEGGPIAADRGVTRKGPNPIARMTSKLRSRTDHERPSASRYRETDFISRERDLES